MVEVQGIFWVIKNHRLCPPIHSHLCLDNIANLILNMSIHYSKSAAEASDLSSQNVVRNIAYTRVVRRQHSTLERADQIRKQSLNIKD